MTDRLRLETVAGNNGIRKTSPGKVITASMGVQSIAYAKTIESLISQADDRLYQAKNGGRNLVVADI